MKSHATRFLLTGSWIAGFAIAGYGCGGSWFGNDKNASISDASGSGGSNGLDSGTDGSSSSSGGSSNKGGSGGRATGGSENGGASGTGGAAGGGTGVDGGAGGTPATCASDPECADGNACNGIETCSGGRCKPGTDAHSGTPCTPYLADGGLITTDGGVSYVCYAGQCLVNCTSDAECDDGNTCTGTESCNPTAHVCQQGTPLPCDDGNACTKNECDPVRGCNNPLIDGDSDGHASEDLGSCGDDCNDKDETIYPGAVELCDGKDNNCDGKIDETAPYWYADCDGDGFAPDGAASVQTCIQPPGAPPSCNGMAAGKWIATAPGNGKTDCWDKDATVQPSNGGLQLGHATAITGAPASMDFDYNCDGVEQMTVTTGGLSMSSPCAYSCGSFGACYCSGPYGWIGTVPECGVTGTYTQCNDTCTRVASSLQQSCL